MEELVSKLEEKYGLMLTRKDVMDIMKVSNNTTKRMEIAGKIVRVPNQGRLVRFSAENVAKLMMGV